MNDKFFTAILPELIGLGIALFKRFKGDSAAAIREVARIRDHGVGFVDAEKAARAEIEKLKK